MSEERIENKEQKNSTITKDRLSAKYRSREQERGFTLIEMIVAVALFSVVMLVSTSALLSLVVANRKAQALQSVMDNLNIALDSMVRAIRMGADFDGSVDCSGNNTPYPRDCTGGTTTFNFRAFGGDAWVYFYDPQTKRIYRSETGNIAEGSPITAPTVTIDNLEFYVVGTAHGLDDLESAQPKVVIVVKGTAGASSQKTRTTFSIQATAVQRVLDI